MIFKLKCNVLEKKKSSHFQESAAFAMMSHDTWQQHPIQASHTRISRVTTSHQPPPPCSVNYNMQNLVTAFIITLNTHRRVSWKTLSPKMLYKHKPRGKMISASKLFSIYKLVPSGYASVHTKSSVLPIIPDTRWGGSSEERRQHFNCMQSHLDLHKTIFLNPQNLVEETQAFATHCFLVGRCSKREESLLRWEWREERGDGCGGAVAVIRLFQDARGEKTSEGY